MKTVDLSHIDTWVFDLDNTLYPFHCRLFDQVSKQITRYVQTALNLEVDEAKKVQREYFLRYGTTLRGLMEHNGVDAQHYLSFVHDIDYSGLPNDQALRNALEALPGRKLIFTAASHGHVNSALKAMELENLFEGVFDIEDANFHPKPNEEPYSLFFERYSINGPTSVFFEDSARNLQPAKARGMATVFMENDNDWAQPADKADYIDARTADLTGFLQTFARTT